MKKFIIKLIVITIGALILWWSYGFKIPKEQTWVYLGGYLIGNIVGHI